MSTAEIAVPVAPATRVRPLGPLATLARRRFQLIARTPRELVVPLLTPIMFALVIAPALKTALHTDASYESFVAIGTVGLLIPLNTMFSGLSVIVDRVGGAQRELLTAPIPRRLLVLGNLLVALAITALQVGVLIAVAIARGIHFDPTATGIAWFTGAAGLFTVGMYGMAEILANRVPRQEEYIARVPAIAILPWFLAGALGHERPSRDGRAQPCRRRRLRAPAHRGLDPRLLSLRRRVTRTSAIRSAQVLSLAPTGSPDQQRIVSGGPPARASASKSCARIRATAAASPVVSKPWRDARVMHAAQFVLRATDLTEGHANSYAGSSFASYARNCCRTKSSTIESP